MTAEVAVLNSGAVALATDSAVTVQISDNKDKIFTGANKLFTLSKYHPVGIMVYGSARINNHPWETMIKGYRKSLNEKCFDTVEEYAKNFIEYLVNFFTPENKIAFFKNLCYGLINYDLIPTIQETIDKQNVPQSLNDKEKLEIVKSVINKFFQDHNADTQLSQITTQDLETLKSQYLPEIDQIITEAFDPLVLNDECINLTRDYVIHCVTFTNSKIPYYSGIVIAGFGEKEYFPVVCDISNIMGVFASYLYHLPFDINCGENNSAVLPFAQNDVVLNLLTGVDPYYQYAIEQEVTNLIADLRSQFLNDYIADQKARENEEQRIIPILDGMIEKWKQNLHKYRNNYAVRPMLNSVAALPKDELAEMAETLVSITSFKRRVSSDAETVGGATDVAVISKGDGFIWIKRKHYFNPEFNHHFFKNYYNHSK